MRRTLAIFVLAVVTSTSAAAWIWPFPHKKVKNPLADVNSKQPDKVLFDRAMDAMGHRKYDIARLSLQTLINTYPDSEYIARAKLGIGDAWYNEGGSTALAQAEIEYKDFITFFPNMPEAAEAQLKVANIHYRQMEKPDRDYTHARRAEDEYRQLILQFPDSKLVPQAEQRLREVQEVLAEREFRIGRFYYMRESWMAAIARLKTVADSYPLYSNADESLYMIGSAYEHEIDLVRHARGMDEVKRGRTIIDFTNRAAEAYSRIITRYPVKDRAGDAKKRLQALNRPAPTPTSAAIATSKKEEASRSETGTFGRIMGNFKHSPDVAAATKVGQPVLNVPEETSAVILARQIESNVNGQSSAGGSTVTLQQLKPGSVPANEPAPKSAPAPAASPATDQSAPGDTGIPEMQPIGASDSGKPTAAPAATAEPGAAPAAVSSAPANPVTATTDNKPDAPQPQSQSNGDAASKSPDSSSAQASQSDQSSSSDQGTSSSKKKKKKGLRKLVPF
ncbi:MAG: outer membrane protein assembly factor BamD [Acidobacteria bacterium]|nr:MAG: outer membrane protein assembly factor BamD [Acidobacteriota bacterium]